MAMPLALTMRLFLEHMLCGPPLTLSTDSIFTLMPLFVISLSFPPHFIAAHEWVKEGGNASSIPLDIAVLSNMREFIKYSRLKQMALKVGFREHSLVFIPYSLLSLPC